MYKAAKESVVSLPSHGRSQRLTIQIPKTPGFALVYKNHDVTTAPTPPCVIRLPSCLKILTIPNQSPNRVILDIGCSRSWRSALHFKGTIHIPQHFNPTGYSTISWLTNYICIHETEDQSMSSSVYPTKATRSGVFAWVSITIHLLPIVDGRGSEAICRMISVIGFNPRPCFSA